MVNVIKDYSKNKSKNYESRSISGSLRTSPIENLNLRQKIEGKDYVNLQRNINKALFKNLSKVDAYLPNSTAEFGHNPVPIAFAKNIKMLNDTKLANKIYNLQNHTWQYKEINYDTLMRTSGDLNHYLKILDSVYGKKVTEKNIQKIIEAKRGIDQYFNKVFELSGEYEDKSFIKKNVVGKLDVAVPNIGDTFNSDHFSVDMSNVDPTHIIGNIDLINSGAIKYTDLSKKEKEMYGQNLIDQKINQLKEFFKAAKYDQELINEIIDALEFGVGDTIGMAEREGLGIIEKITKQITKKATGGITGVDQYMLNRYK